MPTYELHSFQAVAVARAIQRRKHLILFDRGLGKTVVGVVAGFNISAQKWLIVCPRNAVRTWEDHILEWFPALAAAQNIECPKIEIRRWRKKQHNKTERQRLWSAPTPGGLATVYVFIVTPGSFIRDEFPGLFDLIIIDEAQRLGNGRKQTKLHQKLKHHCRDATYVWPMSGTKKKFPPDFFPMLNLINPKRYGSYWSLVSNYMYSQRTPFGEIELLGVRNPEQWYKTLRQEASVITKEEVGKLPARRQLLHVEMTDEQEDIYRQLERDQIATTQSGEIVVAPTAMTRVLRYRQLLVCPKILDPSAGYGAALDDLVEQLTPDTHYVVFTPFVEAIPHIQQTLSLVGIRSHALSGGLTPDEIAYTIKAYRSAPSVAVVSILFAQSFSLEPARESYFLGYDWEPEANGQAEDRLDRLTTDTSQVPINHYYYAYEGTYDQEMAEQVAIKRSRIAQTMNMNEIGLHQMTKI